MSTKKVCVGVILSAHGIKGLVKIKSFTKDPRGLALYKKIFNSDNSRQFTIAIKSTQRDILLASVNGITDRTQAEVLAKTKLYIDRAELAHTNKDEFYISDLVGTNVVDDNNQHFGKIVRMHNFGAGDIVEIQLEGSHETKMLSFNTTNFGEVDLNKGIVRVHWASKV